MKLFQRSIALFLSLILVLSISLCCIPIRAQAYYDPASSTAYAAVGGIVVELFSEGAKLIASLLASGVKAAGKVITVDGLKKCSQAASLLSGDAFNTALTAFKAASFSPGSQFVADEDLVEALAPVVNQVFKGEVTVPSAGTQIYVPPDSIWSQAENITYDRLVNSGFTDLDELNENVVAGNQISWQTLQKIMQLSGYLRTDFLDDFAEKFSSLSSDITTELDWLAYSISDDLGLLSSDFSSYLSSLGSLLSGDLSTLKAAVNLVTTTLSGRLDTIRSALSTFSTNTYNQLSYILSDLDQLTDMKTSLDQLVTLFDNFTIEIPDITLDLTPVATTVGAMEQAIVSKLNALIASISTLQAGLSTTLTSSFSYGFSSLESSLSDRLASIHTTLQGLTANINTWDRTLIDRLMENLTLIKQYQINARDTLQTELLKSEKYEAGILNLLQDELIKIQNYQINARDTLLPELQKIAGYETTINSNMKDYLQGVKDGIFSLQKNVVYRLGVLETSLGGVTTAIEDMHDDLLEQLKSIYGSLKVVTNTEITLPDDPDEDDDDQNAPLFIPIGLGFDKADDFFDETIINFKNEAAGLLVASKIFNEFADIPFFKKLLLGSASIGLIATLLGVAISASGSTVSSYSRREIAAQSKAQSRVKGGLVVQ